MGVENINNNHEEAVEPSASDSLAEMPSFDKEAAEKARREAYRDRLQENQKYNDQTTADDFYATKRTVRDTILERNSRLLSGEIEPTNLFDKHHKELLEHDRVMAIERQGGEGPLRSLRRMLNRILNARSIAEKNARNMNKPTLRSINLDDESIGDSLGPRGKIAREVARKIQDTGKMETIDALALFEPDAIGNSKVMDNAEKFLELLGMDEGTDFDVRMPSVWYNQDNEPSYTPLQISYKNNRDETVRISFSENMLYNKETGRAEPMYDDYVIHAWVGKDMPEVSERRVGAEPESSFSLGPWGFTGKGTMAKDIGVSDRITLDEFAEKFRGVQH